LGNGYFNSPRSKLRRPVNASWMVRRSSEDAVEALIEVAKVADLEVEGRGFVSSPSAHTAQPVAAMWCSTVCGRSWRLSATSSRYQQRPVLLPERLRHLTKLPSQIDCAFQPPPDAHEQPADPRVVFSRSMPEKRRAVPGSSEHRDTPGTACPDPSAPNREVGQ